MQCVFRSRADNLLVPIATCIYQLMLQFICFLKQNESVVTNRMEIIHLLLLFVGIPLVSSECLGSCSSRTSWKYQVGKVYSYNYKVSVSSMIKGNSDEDSSFTISALANFIHSSTCNFDLQVLSRFSSFNFIFYFCFFS